MALVLTYEGALPGRNAESANAVKNRLRRIFHQQLVSFCQDDPYFFHWLKPGQSDLAVVLGGIQFIPVVIKAFVCDLRIELLRRDMPGVIFNGGDIDSRLKTLLDGLRMPQANHEIHGFSTTGDPEKDRCLCLLADDSLITKVEIETLKLLRPLRENEARTDVEARVHAVIRQQKTI